MVYFRLLLAFGHLNVVGAEVWAEPLDSENAKAIEMDVVRYTDTYGYESDNPANGWWEYRDYLIRAFNQDVPFDQLVREPGAPGRACHPNCTTSSGRRASESNHSLAATATACKIFAV